MNYIFYFDDGKTNILPANEDVVIEQMNRQKDKRLYKCGIDFSRVDRVIVVE